MGCHELLAWMTCCYHESPSAVGCPTLIVVADGGVRWWEGIEWWIGMKKKGDGDGKEMEER
ncbi:hypothetical protein PVK06_043835 [Gossypium arboreum]|uniref:Uncharacterized protein n=1 Tax=Gossypium arboreum TaxID=29729 RepID=A0ABR0MPG6_GOSAR|nr:hypothetical protein PVK06_043835 [Gossypium arboreum]